MSRAVRASDSPRSPGTARLVSVVLRYADRVSPEVVAELAYADEWAALADSRGRTVRCTPRRRTVLGPVVGSVRLFRKFRRGPGGAEEWRQLHELAVEGFRAPVPVCLATGGGASVLVLEEVPGRPMDVLLAEAVAAGHRIQARDYAVRVVAPMVARFHSLPKCHRDLYWNHLFARDLTGTEEPHLIDVERVFGPRWRLRRWRIKDLAGLASSLPQGFTRTDRLRFLRAYLGERSGEWKAWWRPVARKAFAIQSHQPKYG